MARLSAVSLALAACVAFIVASPGEASINDGICSCETCCHIDDSADVHMTGKSILQLTYPNVSMTGKYSLLLHQDASTGENVTLPYQYVVKYVNSFRSAFDRNVFVFTDTDAYSLNCSDSHMFYGSPDDGTDKMIDFVEATIGDNRFCTLDINYLLSRDEMSNQTEIWFAFNNLVEEKAPFNIMYDMSTEGLIVPESDILVYPYVIEANSVKATDANEGTAFYIDMELNVSDVSVNQPAENQGTGCLSIDELFQNGNALWVVPGGENCEVTIDSLGVGDAKTDGRKYEFRLDQSDYERCSTGVSVHDGNLHFDFRLQLPVDASMTTEETDSEQCLYFNNNLNVQNFTVIVKQDVTNELTSEYITNFNVRIGSVSPERSGDYFTYPTPHSRLHIALKAVFPSAFGIDFSMIGLPTLGEDGDYNPMVWDDSGDGSIPQYSCENFVDPAGDGTGPGLDNDDYTECTFNFVSTVFEPTYQTTDGECALERNTTRLVTGFVVRQTLEGGLIATHTSGPINIGVDNTEWPAELCEPESEREVINVNDLFEVELDMRNYYPGESVNWGNTTLLSLSDDMIARLQVGQTASTPFDFSDDLEIMIKNVFVQLKNPLTGAAITSYTFSVADKENFMHYSWTPYQEDPRFCSWYNTSAGVQDRCEAFFNIGHGRSNSFHTEQWINETSALECQREGTLVDQEDNNNRDFFLFSPKTWFMDNIQGYVEMTIRVTGIVQKCTGVTIGDGNRRRALAAAGGKLRADSDPDVTTDVLFVSDELTITFVNDDDEGGSKVEIVREVSTWIENNKLLVIISSVVIGVIGCSLVALWVVKRRRASAGYAVVSAQVKSLDF